jgi:hypothetical protein
LVDVEVKEVYPFLVDVHPQQGVAFFLKERAFSHLSCCWMQDFYCRLCI